MWERFQHWLLGIPYSEPLERRQALLIELVALAQLIVALALLPLPLLTPMAFSGRALIVGLTMIVAVAALPALGLVRRGRLSDGAMVSALSLTVALSLLLYTISFSSGAVIVFAYALPLTLAGMVAGRRALLIVLTISVLGVSLAIDLQHLGMPGAGFAAAFGEPSVFSLLSFVVVAGILAVIIDGLSTLIREALSMRRARERELESMSRRLESAVRERTADLEIALSALEQRAAEQERLIAENQRQRATINALSVPVLPLGGRTVVLPLVGEMDEARLSIVGDQALRAVERLAARRLLLDITGVPIIDTHVAHALMRTVGAARLLGAEVALVGIRPEVAQAIVGLGVDLGPLAAYADLQSALS